MDPRIWPSKSRYTFVLLIMWRDNCYIDFGKNNLAKVRMTQSAVRVVVGVLWHINICRLFNAKSTFLQIVLFQTIRYTVQLLNIFLLQSIKFIQTVLIRVIQFSINTDFVYTQSNVKTVLYWTIQFSVSRVSMSKTVPFQTIQFSISTEFKCKYISIVKNISI